MLGKSWNSKKIEKAKDPKNFRSLGILENLGILEISRKSRKPRKPKKAESKPCREI